ncbi:hypothetical protein DFH01_09755 [Falsiroseomonas bella]|uniref:DUF3990 domain-containing protein n=1 Tax=Falsiroseomonas bella TaxID=2184016 RepID=A0A317FFI1_9PROT|nr:hypothetical protein [Falsiroseomonas bella]PWS37142.1 hypothetical protein DFH01_09755 [Falsiroseomonas bella]
MSRLSTSFVLGYHGCDEVVGKKALTGQIDLIQSDKSYDWLGPGAYFWEGDPRRAREWAEWKVARGDYSRPFVIGAVIDLGNCLDLLVRENIELLRDAYEGLVQVNASSGLTMPRNKDVGGDANGDKLLRFLDCAVIKHLHSALEEARADPDPGIERVEPFDTVRGVFTEGEEVYPGSGFRVRTHTQIAVRTGACIKGLFRPR